MKLLCGVLPVAALAMLVVGPAHAITVDGTLDPAYGTPITFQTVQTNFGDNRCCGLPNHATGSELDAAYGTIDGSTLRLMLTGNLNTNQGGYYQTRLDVFIDCIEGGQDSLVSGNPGVLARLSDDGSGNGLKFDSGFAADFYLSLQASGTTPDILVYYATLPAGGGGAMSFLGSSTPQSGTLSGGTNPHGIEATFNNANTIGVPAGCGPSTYPWLVNTGMEFAIPLSALGGAQGCFRVVAYIIDSGNAWLSNQVLGPIPAQCSLGEPRNIDFSRLAGPQFFQICDNPTPTEQTTWGRVKVLYR